MPRIRRDLLDEVDQVASVQDGLVTSRQLVEIGLHESGIRRRARQGGPWERVLPAVYHVGNGPLTPQQRERAALLYVGQPCLLTGGCALRRHGVRVAADIQPDEVHVLVPHSRRRASTEFVHVQRAKHWPTAEGSVAPLPRAVLDACRALTWRNEVDALVTEVVREGHATVEQLEEELARSQRRRTALMRDALAAARAGAASAPEAKLWRLWEASSMPPGLRNADLYLPTGEHLARPDVYVVEHGVAVEVDSRRFHGDAVQWDRTMRRHARMTAAGLAVLHVSPRRIDEDWGGIQRDVLRAVAAQEGRALPDLVIRRRDA